MLPPPPRGPFPPGYPNVKREGTVADNEDDEEEEEEEDQPQQSVSGGGPSFAALGGRPRSVDFDKAERMPRAHDLSPSARRRRDIENIGGNPDHQFFTVHINHVYKRSAQEMTDVETTRVIQVKN